MRVGRRRQSNLTLPAGVRRIGERYYWQPTSQTERNERRKSGLPVSVPLGPVFDERARISWARLAGYRDEAPAAEGTVGELLSLFEQHGLARKLNGKSRSDK